MRKSKKVFYRLVKKNRTKRIDVLASRYGRFNYKNETGEEEPMTYIADTIETAWSEISAHFGLVPSNPEGFRLYQVTLKDIKIVDLTNPDELDKLGISEAELRADPALPQCQEVAKKLRQAGYDGAIYRSVRNPKGICGVLFIESADKKIDIRPDDDEWESFIKGNKL